MCQRCGTPSHNPCGCNRPQNAYDACIQPCPDSGCPIKLDFTCIIYHKDNNQISKLDYLGLTNGATLQLVVETINEKLKQINVLNYNLPCLRATYTISNLEQFAEAVDTQLCILSQQVSNIVVPPLVVNDSNTIDFSNSGTLGHTLTGSVKVSTFANNLLTVLSDGLYSSPQTLSVNAATKELSISNGNTVSLASITCGASGFLGNFTTDPPVSSDGQYWFNTTTSQLKMKLNAVVRQIQIV